MLKEKLILIKKIVSYLINPNKPYKSMVRSAYIYGISK